MLIEIDQVTDTSNEQLVDISINSDFLNVITLGLFESQSIFEIHLTFNNGEPNESFSCHMCRLNEVITYLDSAMTGFYKIDDIPSHNQLIYVDLSKIYLIKKKCNSGKKRKTKIRIDFTKGDPVFITSESEMEKLKQAMVGLNTIKKRFKRKC